MLQSGCKAKVVNLDGKFDFKGRVFQIDVTVEEHIKGKKEDYPDLFVDFGVGSEVDVIASQPGMFVIASYKGVDRAAFYLLESNIEMIE